MSPRSALAREALPAVALLGFVTVLVFPAELPRLFGPDGFAWASWCFAFAVPALACASWLDGRLLVRRCWLFAGYFAWLGLTAFFAVDRSVAAVESAKLLALVAAALAVALLTHGRRRLLTVALLWMAAVAFVVQVLAFMNHVEYGLAERITVYVLPAGWGGYPELGPLVAVQFSIFLAVLVTARTSAARLAAGGLVALSVAQAVFLYARLAWIALAVVFAVVLLFTASRRRALGPLALAALVVAGVIGGASALNPTFRQLLRGAVTGEFGGAGVVDEVTLNVADLGTRSRLWSRTWPMIGDHWTTGVGLGNFRAVFEATYHPEVNDDGRRGVHAHNAFLQQAAELGVPGGALFAALWVVALAAAVAACRVRHDLVALMAIGCVVALLIHNLGDYLSFVLDGPRGRLTTLAWLTLALASLMSARTHPSAAGGRLADVSTGRA